MGKSYTVAEAAVITTEKGITNFKSAEQQIRRWIRKYPASYEKVRHSLHFQDFNSEEEKQGVLHEKASKTAIRAHKESKKKGYTITEEDLNIFLNHRVTKADESIFEFSRKDREYMLEKWEELLKEKDGWFEDVDKLTAFQCEKAFMLGCEAGIKFLKNKDKMAQKAPKQVKKPLITFPQTPKWYVIEELKNFSVRTYNRNTFFRFEYVSIPDLEIKLNILDKHPPLGKRDRVSEYCRFEIFKEEIPYLSYSFSPHQLHYLEKQFVFTKGGSPRKVLNNLSDLADLLLKQFSSLEEADNKFAGLIALNTLKSDINKELWGLENKENSK